MMRKINALVACECSQKITEQLLLRGVNAYSCDIQKCKGSRPDRHILSDVRRVFAPKGHYAFADGTIGGLPAQWDLVIAHPPCTELSKAGSRKRNPRLVGDEKARAAWEARRKAAQFFMLCVHAPAKYVAVENPAGIMSEWYRLPDQYIDPYLFGDREKKHTGLWLKNLPLLEPTCIVSPKPPRGYSFRKNGRIRFNDFCASAGGKKAEGKTRADVRSETFLGIAAAIAEQWTDYIEWDMNGRKTVNWQKRAYGFQLGFSF